jgi:hypothetical protein
VNTLLRPLLGVALAGLAAVGVSVVGSGTAQAQNASSYACQEVIPLFAGSILGFPCTGGPVTNGSAFVTDTSRNITYFCLFTTVTREGSSLGIKGGECLDS